MIEYIKENYIKKTAFEIAQDLQVSTSKVQRQMKKLGLNREEYKKQYLINNYEKIGPKEIAKHFNSSSDSVKAWAFRLGLRHFKEYEKLETFFDIWSPNMAYILGFTIADGYIRDTKSSYCLNYNINTKDREILEYIKNNIMTNSLIKDSKRFDKRTKKYYNKSTLFIYSKDIIISLKNLGLIQAKTGKEILPNIPEEYKSHFLCGYHDGDGYLRKGNNGGYYFEFTCMNEKFLHDVNNNLCCGIGKVQPDRKWYKLLIRQKEVCINLDNYMKTDRDFYLKRKHFSI